MFINQRFVFSSFLGMIIMALLFNMFTACTPEPTPQFGTGQMALTSTGGLEDWVIKARVTCDHGYNRQIEAKFGHYGAAGTKADAYFDNIPAGMCKLQVEIVDQKGIAVPYCESAEKSVEVKAGQTIPVFVDLVCSPEENGGINIIVGVCIQSTIGTPSFSQGKQLVVGQSTDATFTLEHGYPPPNVVPSLTITVQVKDQSLKDIVSISALKDNSFRITCLKEGPVSQRHTVEFEAVLDQCDKKGVKQVFHIFCNPAPTPTSGCLLLSHPSIGNMSNIKLADNTLKNLVDTPSTNYTAYDSSTGDIYFTTWPTGQSGALHRLKADGTLEMLYKLDGGGQGIFLDRTQRRVYWGEYYSGIYYGSMDGAGVLPRTEFISRKQLQQTFGSQHPGFGRSIHGISGMVFNQADNYIYFISVDNHNSSKGTALWRVRIDGSDLKVLHLVVNNACLTVEPTNGYIYIVKDIQGSNRLWRFSLDGSGGIELYTLPSNTICSSIVLDTIADAIYVGGYIASENNSNVLWRFLTDGSDAKKLPHRGGKSGIFISHIASPDNHGICSK